MSYKEFVDDVALTAEELNTYLMKQSVMVFSSRANRTSSLNGAETVGMVSYLSDEKIIELYRDGAWRPEAATKQRYVLASDYTPASSSSLTDATLIGSPALLNNNAKYLIRGVFFVSGTPTTASCKVAATATGVTGRWGVGGGSEIASTFSLASSSSVVTLGTDSGSGVRAHVFEGHISTDGTAAGTFLSFRGYNRVSAALIKADSFIEVERYV